MTSEFEALVENARDIFLQELASTAGALEAVRTAFVRIVNAALPEDKRTPFPLQRHLTADEKTLIDQGARAALASLTAAALQGGAPAMEWRNPDSATETPPAVPRFLDMALQTTELKWGDSALVFSLLENLVETSTIRDCSGVFTWLEEHADALGGGRARAAGQYNMLRMCNQLLRRLSKGHDAVLCGRILIFLARLLPLSDRSGLNPAGVYNLSNITPVEEVEEGATDSNGDPIDVAFYRRFWGLQSVFQNPAEAMKPGPWSKALGDLKAVIAEFQKLKTIAAASSAPDANRELPAVKYLSSSKLMRLQLQDAGFRRQWLTQALIFLHCCTHPGRSEKGAALKPRQSEELEGVEGALFKQLEATPERGAEFAAAVRAVLQDETSWSLWKNTVAMPVVQQNNQKPENCTSFERPLYVPPPAAADPAEPPAKRQAARAGGVTRQPPTPAPGQRQRLWLGTPDLDRLWNQAPNNMAGLRVDERKHLPTLREFMAPVVEDMDPENDIDDEYRRKHDKVYQWKALRMISRESLPIFAKTALEGDLEEAARGFFPNETPPAQAPVPAPKKGTPSTISGALVPATADVPPPEDSAATASAAPSAAGESKPAAAGSGPAIADAGPVAADAAVKDAVVEEGTSGASGPVAAGAKDASGGKDAPVAAPFAEKKAPVSEAAPVSGMKRAREEAVAPADS